MSAGQAEAQGAAEMTRCDCLACWTRRIVVALVLVACAVAGVVAWTKRDPHPLLVDAAADSCSVEPVNPCLLMDCNAVGPRGLLDPDAGALDQRRIV